MKPNVTRADRVALPVSLTYRLADDEHWLQSRVANMSESGMLLGPTNLEPGTHVELHLASPIPLGSLPPARVVCVARVVRTTEAHTAVRFEACRLIES
jgi:hypothetical protein